MLPRLVLSGRQSLFRKTSSALTQLRNQHTQVTTLPNGLRVATTKTNDLTCSVGIFVDGGSSFENKKNNGTAHFLEHMAFKGTTNRTRQGLEIELENMGASLNAYTSREQTVYYAQLFKDDIRQGVDILSDILLRSKFEPKFIEQERHTIIREMEEVSKIEIEVVFDILHALAFRKGSLAHTILGPLENINAINRQHITEYITKYYVGNRIILAAAGGVDHEQVVQEAAKQFSGLEEGGSFQKPMSPFTGGIDFAPDSSKKNLFFTLAYEGVGWDSKDYYAILLLQSLLGSYDRLSNFLQASELVRNVAETDTAMKFTCFNTTYQNTGLIGIYAALPFENVEKLSEMYIQAWKNLALNISPEALAAGKAKLKLSLLQTLDGNTPLVEDLARQLQFVGRHENLQQTFKMIDAINVETFRDACLRKLKQSEPAVVGYGGPADYKLPEYSFFSDLTKI